MTAPQHPEAAGVMRRFCAVLTATLAGLLIGAAGGGLYGLLCALLHAALRARIDRVLPTAGYCLIAGALAGLLIGFVARLVCGEECTSLDYCPPSPAAPLKAGSPLEHLYPPPGAAGEDGLRGAASPPRQRQVGKLWPTI